MECSRVDISIVYYRLRKSRLHEDYKYPVLP